MGEFFNMKKSYLFLVLFLLSCHAKQIPLSDQENRLENQLSLKYKCNVTFSIDERSVGLNRNDGNYSVTFDFSDSQVLCVIDSLTLNKMVKDSYSRILDVMSYRENHENITIGFEQITIDKGIETSQCSKWYNVRLKDGTIVDSWLE